MNKSHHVVALIFDDYETLDLHGPIEMLGRVEGNHFGCRERRHYQ